MRLVVLGMGFRVEGIPPPGPAAAASSPAMAAAANPAGPAPRLPSSKTLCKRSGFRV